MKGLWALRNVFLISQLVVALWFISDAIQSWNHSPIVTSVSFGDISEVPFPSISICHPKSWKWPGLVKAITHYDYLGDAFFIIKKLNMHENASQRLSSIKAMRLMNEEFLGEERTFDEGQGVIETIDRLFPIEGHIRDFVYWLLKLWYSVKDDDMLVGKIEVLSLDAFFECVEKERPNVLEDDNIIYIKNKLCQSIHCNVTENVEQICKDDKNCLETLTLSFLTQIMNIWTYIKFWNPEKLLELMIFEAFSGDYVKDNFRILGFLTGYAGLSLPLSIDMNHFYLWHYFYAQTFSKDDKLMGTVKEHFDTYNASLCFESSKEKIKENCLIVENIMKSFNQSELEKIKNLLDQPKVHGDVAKDYVLIPLCSLGTEPLNHCQSFSTTKPFQDEKCFTFNGYKMETNKVGSANGFNFVLNLDLPQDEPLKVKLFLHDQGTFPDLKSIESPWHEISSGKLTRIGVKATLAKSTQSFDSMSFTKRKCNLRNLKMVNCIIDSLEKKAKTICGCLPFQLNSERMVPSCNMSGSICFRKEFQGAQNDTFECPPACQFVKYEAQVQMEKPIIDFFPQLKKEKDFKQALFDDPSIMFVKNKFTSLEYGSVTQKMYLEEALKGFTVIQVYFEDPQVTIITKDAKATVASMIGNIGGTLGIFLGLSTIGIIDQMINMLKALKEYFSN